MSDLIDRQELKRAMYHRAFETDGDTMWQSGCWVRYRAIEQVIDAQPEHKKGKWVGTESDGYADGYPVYYEWKCSSCGCIVEDEEPTWNYCPYCGAKMDEE